GSSVFFSATLLGVFLLYVADGRAAGRMGLMVVLVTGALYALASALMHAQFPEQATTMFPDSGVRANLGSIAASLVDLVLLGMVWEAGQRGGLARLPLLLRVFATLATVFVVDALIYVPVAWAGGATFSAELWGNLLGRLLVAAACAPFVTLYLNYEIRRHGLVLARHSVLSILLREDAERELLSAHHQLRLGTEALWESEERYRRMVDDIPIMVFRFSIEGLVTYANRPMCAYYGRELDEILGLHVATPIDKDERDELWRKVIALTPASPTVEFVAHVTPSRGPLAGQRRSQRWVVRGLFSPRGGGLAFQAVGEDITERLATERELQRLSTAIAQASECVAMTDARGVFEFVNPALENKTGYTKDDLLGKSARAFLGDIQPGGARSALVRAVGRAEGWTGRLPLAAKDRPVRDHWTTVTPLRDGGGDVNGYVVIAHDVSRESELEAKLLQAQRMEAVGRMAGGVAHDFNNLIFVIWSCAEAASVAVSKLPADLVGSLAADLVDIRTSADRASLLTRQLMTVSRQEATQPRTLDLSIVLGNLEAFLRRLAPGPVELTLDCAATTPRVSIDPVQLERVILNLVTNARDAMPTGGALRVSTRAALLDDRYLTDHPEARRGLHAVLSIVDQGIGMDRETCARIFEPFFTTKEVGRGTGLGLSTVYGIVQQAGGHLVVESAVGKGTTFEVFLPAADEQAADIRLAPRRGEADAQRATILYCENEEDMQTQVVQLLGNGGYRVVCTRDAAETLAWLRESNSAEPRLLLTDMVAAGMSGTELASVVRKLRPALPVALFSGSAVDQERRDGAEGYWFVDKRTWRSALLAAVDEAIRKGDRGLPG
ncbi:MAG TPA: PAS domain S-box protein, partial [Polyangia bacterium]|nr:PAS domain S-box protein [Polyangia bacterium]